MRKSQRNFFFAPKQLGIGLGISIVLGLSTVYLLWKPPLVLIGESDSYQTWQADQYTDQTNGGQSIIAIEQADTAGLTYQYTLKPGYVFHYAYATLQPLAGRAAFNLNGYDEIEIKIKASLGKRIQFLVNTPITVPLPSGKKLKYRVSQYILNTETESSTHTFTFDQLYTPDWWYSEMNQTPEKLEDPNFAQCLELSFSNCINLADNQTDRILIEALKFKQNKWHLALKGIGVVILIPFLLSIAWGVKYLPFLLKHYFPNQFQWALTNEEERIFSHLHQHYDDPNYQISELTAISGFDEKKINSILYKYTRQNFKKYLHQIRIEESKKLLEETSRQVAEIAYSVGYSNVANFNRIFKQVVGVPPLNYRKANTPNDSNE